MEIIDNFLPEDQYTYLEDILLGEDFPWFYNASNTVVEDNGKHSYQFVHLFQRETGERSNAFPLIIPILEKLQPRHLIRAKINMGPRDCSQINGGWHMDLTDPEVTTATIYFNDNNGYTLFRDGTKVESKRNRLASFPAPTEHTGVSHTDAQVRVVLNLNYIV